ncbi:hypothetical protein QA612_14095 [Evansella sp. AB-P1]|uniref:hypothetical protein n=1 Tax=Evansella sp. AB-P1 TaxID=3037653 RepID=UPI00241F50A0|nr:hypothetical protein [Evansella sp. AB-P1]MDG5788612.1 hypothetical protein [Evansella sp. AB-P1]
MSMDNTGIKNYYLKKEEFDLLPFIDSRAYIESSISRFEGWKSSFDTSHPDWKKRIEVQRELADCFEESLYSESSYFMNKDQIKIIFLGASLGSISTYFFLNKLKKVGLLNKTKIYIYDLLLEPLKRTIAGDFELSERAERDCGFSESFSSQEYKRILKNATIIPGSITDITNKLGLFDITVAPYVHHHLNIYDKKLASEKMAEITASNGLIMLGDLHFDYNSFNLWLDSHKYEFEDVKGTYAIESFIDINTHIKLFKESLLIHKKQKSFYYVFGLRRE